MIYEASFSGVVRIIFWFLVITFLIRLVARLAMPIVVQRSQEHMRKQAEAFMRQQQAQQEAARRRQEGDVTIERPSNDRRKNNDGEYVDFVEIKD